MLSLGIETSCDETAISILTEEGGRYRVVSELISSQAHIHELYGGVVPELASREHLRNLPLLLAQALSEANVALDKIDVLSVTRGPGLKGCLLMGASFAKGLSLTSGVPCVGVNHIEAHIFAAALDNPVLKPPFLALVVSGGHTEVHVVEDLGRYRLIARTGDDAAGEAFDKSAVLLRFPYPGGPALAKLADSVASTRFRLPKVMRESAGFSFSGLKTAIALLIRENANAVEDPQLRAELCHAIQSSIVDALVYKLEQYVRETGLSQIVVCGGVSANRLLRERVQGIAKASVCFPAPSRCMDNASMVAYVGLRRFKRGERSPLSFGTLSRWPIEELGQA